ncbi:Wzz/FepE/Etk N-terminal domain-containing protein [Bacillus mojavensis]|uniref:Teichuronic acid biosynthesis protein TuaF, putative hydrolase n=1 Tax=Bacillus mojavensis TaxID=72360 RepID=A0ABX6M592_BACMO|nr:Wzz/FepE/Etk N-terminal domain-containing protein [Bacillus mojavensis]MCY8106019.1 Wzz/FepE/Etk N-terminal domain-containing protein [Bacillus mojavensis]MCY8482992.1 Wzz/FepE/Etk N-terminal domain-containing protein [Bacillus mojavensis]MEC1752713.1 Wzz/FepE/Etk N-terminal domain-containing protein [Bacillus mojavensis]MEC1775511.1 Wzz/FepE/Etk N-terminal domain-containing protein [Bacillus mojavensis]QJC97888.1 Teichuronic acid biosynthesis protein TuaF, putative hydrolase [Bacillus moja
MKDIVIRLARRIKKNIIWIILVPLILGVAGYILPSQIADKKSYTAEVTLAVGSYDHPIYNSTEEIPLLLRSDAFLKEALPDEKDEDLAEIKEKLTVKSESKSLLSLSYADQDQERTESVLNAISSTFLKNDQKLFEEREAVIRRSIDALEGETVSEDSKVDKERFLYELKNTQLNLKAASAVDSETVSEASGGGMSPKKKAVLGVLIGITIAFMFVVIPEFFRESF